MPVISVSLPDTLLEQADTFLHARGYAGRSELVRAAMRDFLTRETSDEETGLRSATLTLLYPHGYERKIGEIRHEFTDIVRSMMHGHASDLCVEVFVLEGDAARIRRFADLLRAARDTRLVHVVHTDAAPGEPHTH